MHAIRVQANKSFWTRVLVFENYYRVCFFSTILPDNLVFYQKASIDRKKPVLLVPEEMSHATTTSVCDGFYDFFLIYLLRKSLTLDEIGLRTTFTKQY